MPSTAESRGPVPIDWLRPGVDAIAYFKAGGGHALNPAYGQKADAVCRLVLDVKKITIAEAFSRFTRNNKGLAGLLSAISHRPIRSALILDTRMRHVWVPADWLRKPGLDNPGT